MWNNFSTTSQRLHWNCGLIWAHNSTHTRLGFPANIENILCMCSSSSQNLSSSKQKKKTQRLWLHQLKYVWINTLRRVHGGHVSCSTGRGKREAAPCRVRGSTLSKTFTWWYYHMYTLSTTKQLYKPQSSIIILLNVIVQHAITKCYCFPVMNHSILTLQAWCIKDITLQHDIIEWYYFIVRKNKMWMFHH